MKRLDLVVGPNGAGKSTFITYVLRPEVPDALIVNADDIARARWPEDPEGHAYEAMEIASRTRHALISSGQDFIAESVFSHESKLDLITEARDSGFTVVAHVLLVPEELSVRRVAARVRAGGHRVPEEKIRTRYQRLWGNVVGAILRSHSAFVWDNSPHGSPILVAQFANGVVSGRPRWPEWTPPILVERWP